MAAYLFRSLYPYSILHWFAFSPLKFPLMVAAQQPYQEEAGDDVAAAYMLPLPGRHLSIPDFVEALMLDSLRPPHEYQSHTALLARDDGSQCSTIQHSQAFLFLVGPSPEAVLRAALNPPRFDQAHLALPHFFPSRILTSISHPFWHQATGTTLVVVYPSIASNQYMPQWSRRSPTC